MCPGTFIRSFLSEAGLVPTQIRPQENACISSSWHAQRDFAYQVWKWRGRLARDKPEVLLIMDGNERPTSFGRWLARQASVTQSVDPAYGVEAVESSWRLNVNSSYPGVLIAKKSVASRKEVGPRWTRFWTDGSKWDPKNSKAGKRRG